MKLRLRVAWAALRGRPVAYRINAPGGIVLEKDSRAFVAECVFGPSISGAGVTVTGWAKSFGSGGAL